MPLTYVRHVRLQNVGQPATVEFSRLNRIRSRRVGRFEMFEVLLACAQDARSNDDERELLRWFCDSWLASKCNTNARAFTIEGTRLPLLNPSRLILRHASRESANLDLRSAEC